MNRIVYFFKRDLLFTLCFFLTVLTSIFFGLDFSSIDFHVIFSLFALMLIIRHFEKNQILDYLSIQLLSKVKNARQLLAVLSFLAFFAAMLLTNDVCILILVPIYLKICRKTQNVTNPIFGTSLLIIAANLGSAFFPFGNPQNLFLFSYYKLPLKTFFSWSAILGIFSFVLILAMLFIEKKQPISTTDFSKIVLDRKKTILLCCLFFVLILAILKLLPFYPTLSAVCTILLFIEPKQITKVDYQLLLTFILFFLVVHNFAQITWLSRLLKSSLNTELKTFLVGAGSSQVISNVPAAILLAPFSTYAKALYFGVNVGGLGTLIASLANLIGYRIFAIEFPDKRSFFLKKFTLLNFILLLISIAVFSLLFI